MAIQSESSLVPPVETAKIEKTVNKAITDNHEEETKKALDAQKKVTVRVPRIGTDPNKPDPLDAIPVPVIINGYSYYIKRGEKVEVPQTVADILEQAGYLG